MIQSTLTSQVPNNKIMSAKDEKLHRCLYKDCTESFDTVSELTIHITVHLLKRRPFICEWQNCNKKFSFRNGLRRHLIQHSGENSYRCQVCDYTAAQKVSLIRHVSTYHKNDSYEIYINRKKKSLCQCPNCETVRGGGEKVVDSDGNRLHNCQYCVRIYKKAMNLAQHLKKHTGELRYTCKWYGCENMYFTKEFLDKHSVVHAGKEFFECDDCGKKTTNKVNLAAHLKSHKIGTSETYYSRSIECLCPNCQASQTEGKEAEDSRVNRLHNCHFDSCYKVYKDPSQLRAHLTNAHTSEHRYACHWPGCQRSFVKKFSLRAHMQIHTGEKKFECDLCGFRMLKKSNLVQHIETHYKIKEEKKKKKRQREKSAGVSEYSNVSLIDLAFNNKNKKKFLFLEAALAGQKLPAVEHHQMQIHPDELGGLQLQNLDQWWPKDFGESSSADVRKVRTEKPEVDKMEEIDIKDEPILS